MKIYILHHVLVLSIYTQQCDLFNKQAELDQLNQYLISSDLLDANERISWYNEFLLYSQQSSFNTSLDSNGYYTNETLFYDNIANWLQHAGKRFDNDIIFDTNNEYIISNRISSIYKDDQVKDSSKQVVAMKQIRKDIDLLTKEYDIPSFPFSFSFIFWEQYAVIDTELARNVILSLVAIFIFVELLIAHPITATIVFGCVTMTLIDLMGVMYIWGLGIDSIAVVNLVLAIGLAVDYSAQCRSLFYGI